MNKAEARQLVERCLARFPAAGLRPLDASAIAEVSARPIASLWAGMGSVYALTIKCTDGPPVTIVAKRIELPSVCDSIGDQRKKDSYDVEAAFYSRGHAERLIGVGARVPFPLHVEAARGEGLTICMTKLDGCHTMRGASEAFVRWLATLHAAYWGARADVACASGGLQAQGCYWHLDTRPEEHRRMGSNGWLGRLKLAARAIDLRLKADPMQSVCHGDAKGANILYIAERSDGCQAAKDGSTVPLVYDFQYCGKAAVTKDLAYYFNVEAEPAEEAALLTCYHRKLSELLAAQGESPPSLEALKTSLELALCDWRRFSEVGLGGWGDGRANRRVQLLLDKLDSGRPLGSEEEYIEAMQRVFPTGL